MRVCFFLTAILVCSIQRGDTNEPTIVHTNYGDILGYQTDLARVFYGIPFAQPPINKLRWNPPVPVTKWDPQVLNATSRAPACPQPPCIIPGNICPLTFSEDCLYLNVFTPRPNQSSSSPLPVILFIPGGAFQILDASAPLYNPEHLVNTTNVIVVFIQYRLGVLGFYASGTGPDDIKGNYGLLDQRLAMAWVKENIDAFGGDPNEITLAGQSAGGQSTALHYVTSDMQSYFKQFIVQSAPMTIAFKTYDEYITPGVLLAEQLHCAYKDIACFRAASVENITAAQTKVDTMLIALDLALLAETWVPVIDNVLVHSQLYETIQNVSFPLKPLIIGTLSEESLVFIYTTWNKSISISYYSEIILGIFRNKALKVLERFPPSGTGDQRPLIGRILTQWLFACTNRIFARKAANYSYVYGYPYDFDGWGPWTFCNGHVCHGVEIPYLMQSNWGNFTDAGRRVSESMGTYWTNFAKSQDPNEPLRISTSWPKVTTGNETYMYFQDPLQVQENYLKSDCDFWDDIGYKREFF